MRWNKETKTSSTTRTTTSSELFVAPLLVWRPKSVVAVLAESTAGWDEAGARGDSLYTSQSLV